ncbi:MAG: ABC transporter permease subunit [Chlamydiota bacterium]|nr:ABC transporter permease subunit [Chlamydiota bacterium]
MVETIFSIIIQYRVGLLQGLLVTLEMCLIIWIIGIVIGSLLGAFSTQHRKGVGTPTRIIGFILSGLPVLVLLFWLHYPLQEVLGVVINPFITSVFALSLVNIFAVSEIMRVALIEFPSQYIIAGRVCGLSRREIFRKIQFPIIFRQIMPGILTTQVNMLQLTLFASLISVEEIFRVAQRINSSIYKPVEIYTALGIFFLIVCLPLNGLALYLKKRYTRNLSEN